MSTLIRDNLELQIKDTDVGIPSGYVLVTTKGTPVRLAFDLVGDVPAVIDDSLRQSIATAVAAELKTLNLVPTRVFIGA